MSDEMVEINFDSVVTVTDRAWLLDLGDCEIWFPRSICEIDYEDNEIIVPEWLAIEKGLV